MKLGPNHAFEGTRINPGSLLFLTESHPLRAMDALHVACALAVEPDIFVAADPRQLSAARKAGLKIVDVS